MSNSAATPSMTLALSSSALLAVSGFLLAFNLALPKLAYTYGFAPLNYLALACFGTAILLWLVAWATGNRPRLDTHTIRYGLVAGLLTVVLPSGILFLAIPHVGAGFVTLTGALPPIFTYALALLLRFEPPNGLRAGGVLAGVAGVAVLGWSKFTLADADPVWIVITLLVPVIVASANIYRARSWPKGATALSLAPLMLTGASFWLAIITIGGGDLVPAHLASGAPIILALQIAVMTALYIMYFVVQRYAGTVYFSQIGSIAAVFGTILATAWFHEVMPPLLGLSAALLALGVAGVTLGQLLVRHDR